MKPAVVNVRDYPLEYGQPYIYVGRYMPGRFRGHPLGNPFRVPRKATLAQRQECLEKYRAWLAEHPQRDELLRQLAEKVKRTGYPLACWCAPKLCHAEVLAEEVAKLLEQKA